MIVVSGEVPRVVEMGADMIRMTTRMPPQAAFLLSLAGCSAIILTMVTWFLSRVRLLINMIPVAGAGGVEPVESPASKADTRLFDTRVEAPGLERPDRSAASGRSQLPPSGHERQKSLNADLGELGFGPNRRAKTRRDPPLAGAGT